MCEGVWILVTTVERLHWTNRLAIPAPVIVGKLPRYGCVIICGGLGVHCCFNGLFHLKDWDFWHPRSSSWQIALSNKANDLHPKMKVERPLILGTLEVQISPEHTMMLIIKTPKKDP